MDAKQALEAKERQLDEKLLDVVRLGLPAVEGFLLSAMKAASGLARQQGLPVVMELVPLVTGGLAVMLGGLSDEDYAWYAAELGKMQVRPGFDPQVSLAFFAEMRGAGLKIRLAEEEAARLQKQGGGLN